MKQLYVILALFAATLVAAEEPAETQTHETQAVLEKETVPTENGTPQTTVKMQKSAFTLATPDGQNTLRIGASMHLDARAYLGDSVAPNSFDIRRARIDVQGALQGFMTYRIQAALEGNAYIRNAWLDLKHSDGLHLRLGQMKVPYSTEWMTQDNQVNFLERGSATPVYPFFDRGLMLWGELAHQQLTYSLGIFNGSGIDADASTGDIDDHKDVALRLFSQPFRNSTGPLQNLYVVAQGTYGQSSVPTRRFELGGLAAADYESRLWRWRTEQLIATNGRATDMISGEIEGRKRLGAELLYVHGPLSASVEWLTVEYDGISIYHDYSVASNRIRHDPVLTCDGGTTSISAWISVFLTGENKKVNSFGWVQPDPAEAFSPAGGAWGAWELLARFSSTETDKELFNRSRVPGFTTSDLPEGSVAVGEGGSVTAAVIQGASKVYEATIGTNWTINHNFRIQLNLSHLWAPNFVEGVDGIVSGGASDLADYTTKNTLVESEFSAGLRFIFRL